MPAATLRGYERYTPAPHARTTDSAHGPCPIRTLDSDVRRGVHHSLSDVRGPAEHPVPNAERPPHHSSAPQPDNPLPHREVRPRPSRPPPRSPLPAPPRAGTRRRRPESYAGPRSAALAPSSGRTDRHHQHQLPRPGEGRHRPRLRAQAHRPRNSPLRPRPHPPDIDALTYALHDRQIQREIRVLSRGHDEHTALLAGQQQALRNQLHQSEQLLKQRRIAELTEAGALPLPPPTDDPRQLARAWLGRYLFDEKEALVRDIATAAGVPSQKAAPIRSIRDKITKCIDSGWLTAPVSDTVQQLLALDDHAFRRCLVEDASRQNAWDDALCHPLVLNRWRDQLNAAIAALAPAAENPTTRHLHDLAAAAAPRPVGWGDQLTGRRRLLAALLQRRSEYVRLITDLNDTMTLAERADPSYHQLKRAADQAYDELVRRHPYLYHRIRTALAPYETRYGRLQRRTPRADLRDQIFAGLNQGRG